MTFEAVHSIMIVSPDEIVLRPTSPASATILVAGLVDRVAGRGAGGRKFGVVAS